MAQSVDFLLDVDLSGVPRGHQSLELATVIRDAIRHRGLPTGVRLPPTRSVADALGVSRGTVVRAYEQLAAEGYLLSRRGSGTEVAAVPDVPHPEHLTVVNRSSNPGLPSGASFPRSAWGRCAAAALSALPDQAFGYGDPAGFPALRTTVAGYLGRVRATSSNPDRVVITNGFAQASRLVAEVLMRRGFTSIGVEDPGAAGFREQMAHIGMGCVGIAVDDEGIDVDALSGSGVRAVFVTPAHQFPTGVVLSSRRRRQLIEWAQDTDSIVIEDDYDAEFRYDRAPVGAMQGLDPDHVIYGGSVSKTLAPGIRVGWLVVPERWFVPIVDAKYAAGLGMGVLDQATLSEFIATGAYERHLRKVGAEHRKRRDALISGLAERRPDWAVRGAEAGLHVVVDLGEASTDREATAADLVTTAGLDARPMANYRLAPAERAQIVIGYGHLSEGQIARAVERLL